MNNPRARTVSLSAARVNIILGPSVNETLPVTSCRSVKSEEEKQAGDRTDTLAADRRRFYPAAVPAMPVLTRRPVSPGKTRTRNLCLSKLFDPTPKQTSSSEALREFIPPPRPGSPPIMAPSVNDET